MLTTHAQTGACQLGAYNTKYRRMAETLYIASNRIELENQLFVHTMQRVSPELLTDHRSTWKNKRKQGIDKRHDQKHAGRLKLHVAAREEVLPSLLPVIFGETCHLGPIPAACGHSPR